MAVVPRGVVFALLFYLTLAVIGTLWISMQYLNDRNCLDFCKRQYNFDVDSKFMEDAIFEHDFGHIKSKRAAPATKSGKIDCLTPIILLYRTKF